MSKFDFIGQTDEKGQFKIYNRAYLEKFFELLPNKRFKGHIEVEKESVSDPYRRYYFGCVVHEWQKILRELGNNFNLEQTHEYIKQFSAITQEESIINDVVYRRFKSITELSPEEMREYVADLVRTAAVECDHHIPDPGEY